MLHAKKILIVDAAESTRHFMRYILTNAGYRVFTANSNGEALELVDDSDFDAVFVDIRMPDMEGVELIKTLRTIEGYESAPILAVAMAHAEAARQKSIEAGATEWIAKPVSPAGILRLLKNLNVSNGPVDPRFA